MALLTAILTFLVAALRSYPLWAEQASSQRERDAETRKQAKDENVRAALGSMRGNP